MSAFRDLTGLTFNRWTVLHRTENNARGQTQWLCRCACGTERICVGNSIVRGNSKSCGCYNSYVAAEKARNRNRKHGHTARGWQSPEYVSWCSMWNRCTHPYVNGYEYYGGRGIAVCDRWRDFQAFLADMGPKPIARHTIDRIDSSGDYEPSNCRWATPLEQRHNRRGHKGAEVTSAIYPEASR